MLDILPPFTYLDDPAFVMKRELLAIPIFGWFSHKAGMIPIDRDGAAKTLRGMVVAASEAISEGRQVVIFPEGTRREPGAEPDYQPGVAGLYRELGVPCVPVATNSGRFWPAHGLIRWPETRRVHAPPAGLRGVGQREVAGGVTAGQPSKRAAEGRHGAGALDVGVGRRVLQAPTPSNAQRFRYCCRWPKCFYGVAQQAFRQAEAVVKISCQ